MGTIISHVQAIDDIWWKSAKKNQTLKATDVVVIGTDGHDVMVAKLADGTFVCSKDLGKYAYMPGEWPWTKPVLTALVKLGAITQDDMDRHMGRAEELSRTREAGYQAETLERTLREAGLQPSAEQAEFISAHTKKSSRG